jgi:hypothetical protein
MSKRIQILRDRLQYLTDHDMKKRIMIIIKELEAEHDRPSTVEVQPQSSGDIK